MSQIENLGQRKGQVSIFVALGVALLIIVALVLYVVSISPTPEQEEDFTAVQRYLESCVDEAVFEYLDNLKESPGLTAIDARDIFTNGDSLGLSVSQIESLLLERATNPSYEYSDRLFGRIVLQPLCDPYGPNAESQSANPRCPKKAYGENSMQQDISDKISEAIGTCIANGDSADESLRLGVDLNTINPTDFEVIFSQSTIQARALFDNEELSVARSYDVRLLPLYSFVLERLKLTTRTPNNNIWTINEYQKSPIFRDGFTLTYPTQGGQTIVVVEDQQSFYRGEVLGLQLVVPDRPAFMYTKTVDDTETTISCDPDPNDEVCSW